MDEKKNISQYLFKKSSKNKNKLKNSNKILSKTEMAFYDIVEQKDITLKNLKTDTNNIKKQTIKEFIYSNKKIPNLWKNKKNFKNVVLEMFVEDNNFLSYLGSGDENDSIKIKNKTQIRPKTVSSKKNNLKQQLRINTINDRKIKKKLTLGSIESIKYDTKSNTTNISLSSYKKKKKPKIKLRKIISQQEEIQNVFDNLKEKYPFQKKLQDLFPENKYAEEINKENNNNKLDNLSTVENLIDKSRLHKIRNIERNIFNNLLSLNKKNNITPKYRQFLYQNENNKNSYKRFTNIKLKNKNKKETIKNELNDSIIYNHLNSMNFYGPYFSYCPYCCNNNIKYYKHMERKQCLSLLNYIKMDRNKKLEIEESKFRDKIKMEKLSFN